VEVSATKVEGVSVSTRTADLGGHRMVLVGMVLRGVDMGVVVDMGVAGADTGHREVVVGMEVGTVPISNGRAQGWTRIATQSDQGIEHVFSGVPPGPQHGVSLPECFCLFIFSLARGIALTFSDASCKYPVLFRVQYDG